MTTYVTYTSVNEMFVCTKEDEADMLQEYFLPDDRDSNDFDRVEDKDFPYASSRLIT